MDYRRQQEAQRLAARRQQEQHAAAFAAAATQGRVAIVDAMGRTVHVGDLVSITNQPAASIFRVAEASPILTDPRMVGMLQVRFVADLTLFLPNGQPQGLLIVQPGEVEQIVAAADAAAAKAGDAAADPAAAVAEPPAAPASTGPRLVLTD